MKTIPVWVVMDVEYDSLVGIFVDRPSADTWVAENQPDTCDVCEVQFSALEFSKLKNLIHSLDN